MRIWLDPPAAAGSDELGAAIGGHPLVADILARRGFADPTTALAFLDPEHYTPAPPETLPDLERAVARLEQAIARRETICVWGDFDVDGQTATALLVATLRNLGAEVVFRIPLRDGEGHGVHLPALERLMDDGIQLLLTCDTGTAAHEAIDYARSRGIDALVTDHHDLPPVLPNALALVNPKRLPEGHPLGELPGVGVAYKLAEALYARAGQPEAADGLLDLVALGIVADVALLAGDTRYLLQRGLQVLRKTERLGLQALIEAAGLDSRWLSEEHIGFELGPRLNALGRLSDANAAVELLTTPDLSRARILATQLEGLNAQRKLLTNQVFQAALAQVEREPSLLAGAALVLAHPSWPAAVIGIVASRLVDRFSRPVLLLSTPAGELARGSARSLPGCNISAAIARHGDMLASYGGHPMAAGLAIDPGRIPAFRQALTRTVQEMLGVLPSEPTLQIDGHVSLAELSLDLVAELERLAPFGPGNPPPALVTQDLVLKSHRPVGRDGEHLQLTVEDQEGMTQRVIWWQGAGQSLPEGRFDLAHTVRASDYRGQRQVQVEWLDSRLREEEVEAGPPVPVIEVIDCRQEAGPRARLQQLQADEGVEVWGEGEGAGSAGGRSRHALEPARALAIWTAPPGRSELQAAVRQVSPERVYLFGIDPGMDHPDTFLNRLAGLVKHALRAQGGQATLAALAAATAQREEAVHLGICWLEARGLIQVVAEEDDKVEVRSGNGQRSPTLSQVTTQLQAILKETAAYRRHFMRSSSDSLL